MVLGSTIVAFTMTAARLRGSSSPVPARKTVTRKEGELFAANIPQDAQVAQ
jgi:hypothetical protein